MFSSLAFLQSFRDAFLIPGIFALVPTALRRRALETSSHPTLAPKEIINS
jgi:hypothetical protein